MKIGVIAASGKQGKLISAEAKSRGHEVTAIVRNAGKVEGYPVIEKDIMDLQPADLIGFDAVVSAYGAGPDEESAKQYVPVYKHLMEVFEQIPKVRLLIVGGAATLYTDLKGEHRMLESIPEQWRAVPYYMSLAFEDIKKSSANWTFFSPAGFFDPEGPRTGKYQIGSDYVILNAQGESYLSYADYAIAMVDEIEGGMHVRKRFTAVSDKAAPSPDEKKKPIGIFPEEFVFEGASQYRSALCAEFAGKQLSLMFDRQEAVDVVFLTGHDLIWSWHGGESSKEHYDCAKLDESTYFVNFEFKDKHPRTNLTLVVDYEQGLVTLVNCYTHHHSLYPYLIDAEYDFGYIVQEGKEPPRARHGFTTDLVGKRIKWTYSPYFSIVHVYYHANYMRVTFDPADMREPDPVMMEEMRQNPYDEKTWYIKIKEGVYLVNCSEQNMSRRGRTGNSMLFLEDLKRMHDVGRSFGHATDPATGEVHGENYIFGAYGKWMESDGSVESLPNVYVAGLVGEGE
ncbi:MAG: NAD(P)H-binding protein [Lachnospiraceae bacterium]|nr:NAD(P)H-binding protein [Lachnospiraceae bacterium]